MGNEVTQTQNELELPASVKDLRVAGILDELSERFFPYECKFINLDARAWEEQIEAFNPHMLFVESVWNGYQKTWRGKFTPRISNEVFEVVNWCKEKKIPTVFWNKEDPIHMFTFLGAAFLFDYVFTTDMDCVPLYKRLLGHNRVGVLPFATAIQLFNPVEKYERKDAACFAGSYYAKREERSRDFESLADTLIEHYALDIYDRNPYPDNPDYTFPERYRKFILGTLPVEEVDLAYKNYKLGITLNIVKHSSTMEARRIFELLSCNTLTVSNPCLGIKNLFGDLVIYNERPEEFAAKLKAVLSDENYHQKLRLLALRKVIQEHTYKERLEYLYHKIFGISPVVSSPKIAVFAIVKTPEDVKRARFSFDRQTYPDKQLFIFAEQDEEICADGAETIYPLQQFHTALSGGFDFYAGFFPNNYYGKNYLLDMVLATRYVDVSVIGKSDHYKSNNGVIEHHEELGSYRFLDRMRLDRAMFEPHLLKILSPERIAADFTFEHLSCFSVDALNFCENHPGDSCSEVDDLQMNTGINMQDLYRISDSLTPELQNYSLGCVLEGHELSPEIDDQRMPMRFEKLPLGYLGFFAVSDRPKKVVFDNRILLSEITVNDELTRKRILHVYINGLDNGHVAYYVNYFTQDGQNLGAYLVASRACIAIPTPEDAHYCRLSISVHGEAHGMIKEVAFGPRVNAPIAV